MVAQGLSIIFISHKLDEVLRVSQRIAVLRGGRLVAEARTGDTTQAQLAQWMVGHAVAAPSAAPPPARRRRGLRAASTCSTAGSGRDRLRRRVADAARRRDRRHRRRLRQRPGGAGRAAVRHARAPTGGTVRLMGRALPPTPARLVAARRRAHSGRPACGRRGRRPAGVGERGVGAAAQRGVLALARGSGAAPRARHARRVEKAFDVRGAGLDRAGALAVRRQHAEADPRARAAGAGARSADAAR